MGGSSSKGSVNSTETSVSLSQPQTQIPMQSPTIKQSESSTSPVNLEQPKKKSFSVFSRKGPSTTYTENYGVINMISFLCAIYCRLAYMDPRQFLGHYTEIFGPVIPDELLQMMNRQVKSKGIQGLLYDTEMFELTESEQVKFGLKNVKKANLLSIPFEDNFFDLIVCMDIYGNLDQIESQRASKEIHRVCNKGGYLIINTSALPWMYSLHDKAWDIKQRYYLDDLAKTLENCNFKILKKTYRVSILFPFIFILRFLERVSRNSVARGDTHKTNLIFNLIFYKIMQLENFLLRFINLPIGNSVFIIAQK